MAARKNQSTTRQTGVSHALDAAVVGNFTWVELYVLPAVAGSNSPVLNHRAVGALTFVPVVTEQVDSTM
jgi:hypothetical protein